MFLLSEAEVLSENIQDSLTWVDPSGKEQLVARPERVKTGADWKEFIVDFQQRHGASVDNFDAKCPPARGQKKASVWQWEIKGKNVFDFGNLDINTYNYICRYGQNAETPPACSPSECADDQCTKCIPRPTYKYHGCWPVTRLLQQISLAHKTENRLECRELRKAK